MKTVIIITLALIGVASLIWLVGYDAGFVLVQYGNWQLATSLIVFLVVLVILFLLGYLTLRSIVFISQTPKKLTGWRRTRLHYRITQTLHRGLIALEEGRWAEAEKQVLRHAGQSNAPMLHYLAAARAAQKQSAADRRDNYLRLAHKTAAGAYIAVGLAQAELQLMDDQKEQALATLEYLRKLSPKHPYVLRLLQQIHTNMHQWQAAREVLSDLQKCHILAVTDVNTLFVDATIQQLQAALGCNDWIAAEKIWQQTPRKIRQATNTLTVYVSGLISQGKMSQAAKLIENCLRKKWNDQLVYYYGLTEQKDVISQLVTAEKWLQKQQKNPWLLLTLGRLAKANQLWGKAEEYLKSSLQYGARGETYKLLAEVLTAQGKDKQVMDAYQHGLDLMLNQMPLPSDNHLKGNPING